MITALSHVPKDLVFPFQLEAFIEGNSEALGSAAESGRNAVEAATADLVWTNTHKDEILKWLTDPATPTPETTTPETTPDKQTTTPDEQTTTPDGSGNIAANIIIITAAFLVAFSTQYPNL
jgi:hypothetical protein